MYKAAGTAVGVDIISLSPQKKPTINRCETLEKRSASRSHKYLQHITPERTFLCRFHLKYILCPTKYSEIHHDGTVTVR